ncbi:hypothetical protein KGF56_000584 [Candida oxycetoniae]|uniref:Cytochrome P450 n=1 Tax=Candida oxycetoniae TaxID=497107 RepID=A0AAI9T0C4_9ASCO|nr:uncharacterized protein KGF56_000584 [Candida oxycetoniae]KAI3406453.2 hypothetical protein KGF56_000584 [Candida oxycetoniae]
MNELFQKMKVSTFKNTLLFTYSIFTIEPENIRYMCSSANFDSWNIGDRPKAFHPLLGDGIFSSEGTSWKHSRIMLRPFFTKENIKQITLMEPYVQRVIKLLKQKQGKVVDLQEIFQFFTIDYTTKFLLGESCDALKDALGETTSNAINKDLKLQFAEAFDQASESLMLRMALGKYFMWLVNSKPFHQAIKTQHDFVEYYIQKALALDEDELTKVSQNNFTFLYEIAKQTKDKSVLRDEIMSIILAGRNTTSSLLTFLFFELSRNEEIYEKLKQEIRQKFTSVESITFASIQDCEYLRWCIYETLRHSPAVPFSSKTATVNTILPTGGGEDGKSPVFVRKGQKVIYSMFTANRTPKYFGAKTEEFIPERFAELPKSGGSAFMPFSTGPRLCLGQQLALTETSYMTIRLLQTFDSIKQAPNTPYPPRTNFSATMRLMDGCPVLVDSKVEA